jgi:metal-responsive CopG/Arc/MetJ family transcriptional regulator
MRTTIELPDNLISVLHALAVKKGYRGYSKVIKDALDFYLRDNERRESSRKKVLKMRGSWSEAEAEEIRIRLEEIRKNWKI